MKNKKKKKGWLHTMLKGKQREDAIAEGFYDGRFKLKIVPDKKKQNSKNACKKWKGD